MLRNLVGVLLVILCIGGAFWAGNYTHDYLNEYMSSGTLPALGGSNNLPLTTAVSTQATNTVVAQNSTGSVKVLAVTPTSITVQALYNQVRIFNLSSSAPVYGLVKEGEVGKGLNDITVGGKIIVFWNKADPARASMLAFPRDPSLVVTPEESVNFLTGKVTAISGSDITITPSDGSAPVVVTLTSLTGVATTVLAGQKGRALTVGSSVTANGLSSGGGKVTAKLITISLSSPAAQ